MAVLQLRLDVDGDVYPELHAMLCALRDDALRAERLRQLASTGLIWEALRLPPREAAVAEPAPSLPVLRDEVEASELPALIRAGARQAALATSTRIAAVIADPDRMAGAARRTGTRSRLLRMKEKGLFNNG